MGKYDKMSKSDLDKETADLQAKLAEVERAKGEYDGRRMKELREKWADEAREAGFTLDQVMGGKSARKSGGGSKAAPKYRHPENSSVTWSGRGRQPVWFKEHVEKGGKAEDLAI